MYDFIAFVYGTLSMFTIAFFASQTLNFHKYWIDRSREYSQALTFMASENWFRRALLRLFRHFISVAVTAFMVFDTHFIKFRSSDRVIEP